MKRLSRHSVRLTTSGWVGVTIGLVTSALASNAVADEPFQAQLRLLDHNVFGRSSNNCEQRGAAFGHIVANATPAYDIVALTEYLPGFPFCDPDPLGDAIRCTG